LKLHNPTTPTPKFNQTAILHPYAYTIDH
jgi:hypothetical protein